MLSSHQLEKANEVLDLIRQNQKIIVIEGSAGTGKTYMVNELITMIRNEFYKYGLVYVTAPTHKAVDVITSKIEYKSYIEFKTIHSGLQLQRRFMNGEAVYAKKRFNPRYPPFPNGKLLIVDEASMVGNKAVEGNGARLPGMLDLIEEFKDQMTIIYLGDRKQLNPVNENDSPVFTKGYPIVNLTEIKRQGEGNPIIHLSHNLKLIWTKQEDVMMMDKQITKKVFSEEQGKELELTIIKKVMVGYTFTADRQKIISRLAATNGTTEYKYLAYTNEEVDAMNTAVRKEIYGNPKKVEVGERIIFNAPYEEYMNNQEILVESCDVIVRRLEIPTSESVLQDIDGKLEIVNRVKMANNTRPQIDSGGKTIPTYDIFQCKCYLINDNVVVVHEDSEREYHDIIMDIQRKIDREGLDYKAKYYFKEQVADITYAHAVTVHKSQGSTYEKVIINFPSIMINRNNEERRRMTYTAITRASDLVILFNVK